MYIATWYPKDMHAYKTAIWFSFSSLGSALGGIIAFLIQKNLEGWGPFPSWAYLMLIEGVGTVLWGILALFITPDIPARATFLTQSEKQLLADLMKRDHTSTDTSYDSEQVYEALKDYKTWLLSFM
jgi:MFS family permease